MRRFLFCFYVVLHLSFFSEAREYYFQHFNSSDGLSHHTIKCAVQDEKGFMWFGTKSGLSRFDGYRFINYYHEKDKEYSLPDNSISSIVCGMDGEIWVSTSEGLVYYTPENEHFNRLVHNGKNINNVSRIIPIRDGRIWALCGLDILVIDTHVKEVIDTINVREKIAPLSSDNNDEIWFSSSKGYIIKMDEFGRILESIKLLNDTEVEKNVVITSVHTKSDGDLIVFTNNSGIRNVSLPSGKVSTIINNEPNSKNVYVFTTLRYSENEIWAGTETGVHIYDIRKSVYTSQLSKSYYDSHSISDNAIHVLTMDRDNGVWCGSFFNGLSYLPNEVSQLKTYFPRDEDGNTRANVIRDLVPQGDNLIIGTEDGGLYYFDKSTENFFPIKFNWKEKYSPSNIQSVLAIDEKTLWVGTFDNGIFAFDLETGELKKKYNRDQPDSGIPNFIVKLFKTRSGEILAGSHLGVFLYEPDRDRFSKMSGTSIMIKDIYEDSKGTLWVATQGNGLLYTNSVSVDSELKKSTFPIKMITSVFEDSSNNFYVNTEGEGSYHFDRLTGIVSPVINPIEYPGVIAYEMIEDMEHKLWISTSIGLFKYDRVNGIEGLFTTSNGLITNQFNYNSKYLSPDGTIYFGSVMGLVSFSPDALKGSEESMNVYITTVEAPHFISNNPVQKGNIKLKHNQNTISISYAVPSYSISNQLWYRYKLDGVDDSWTTVIEPADLQYTALSAGCYRFTVQVSSDRNEWRSTACYDIVVLRPFWRSIFAELFYILASLLIVLICLKNRSEKQRKEEMYRMEVMKADKEKEAMSSMVNFFTNITHEIRTPLTIICGTLNRIEQDDFSRDSAMRNYKMIRKHTQRLYDLVNQILDFRKLESSSIHLSFERLNLKDHLQEQINVFSPLAQSKKVKFSFYVEEGDYWTMSDKEALTKIISNLLSNAIKFCESKVSVSLKYEIENDKKMFIVSTENDGELLPSSYASEIFRPFYQYKSSKNLSTGSGLGLPLAKSLAELMDGKLYYDCAEDRQINRFVFHIPANTPVEAKELREEISSVQNVSLHSLEIEDNDSEQVPKYAILVVDDEEDMRHLLYEELSGSYTVYVAENGKKALEILDKKIISLIVSDIMMPVMNGLELCKEVKSNVKYCHIPIIMLTAKVSLQSHIDALDSKADAFIEKPFSHDHFMAMISNQLTNRELMHSTFIHSPYAHLSSLANNKIDEKFLEKINNYIMENLGNKDLSVDDMADHMNMSLSSFYRKVKLTTSLSPSEFVRLCRLKKAAELLNTGNFRINEVSDMVGFSSQSRFASYFMRQFGITPSQFLKKRVQ